MSLAKCLLSVSTTWGGLGHSSLQLELERLRIMMERKCINEQRVETTRECSLGLSVLSRKENSADATVSLKE